MLKLSTCRAVCGDFFGDKKVIRRSINNTNLFAGAPATQGMRSDLAWDGFVSTNLEQRNYQPKPSGIGRTEQLD